jgi:predicted MFS family arabinose efflux permease
MPPADTAPAVPGFTVGDYGEKKRPVAIGLQHQLPASAGHGLSPAGADRASEMSMPLVSGQGDERGGPPKALQKHQWLVLLSLNVIGPFASDAYLPNLPNIKCDLATSSEDASLTIQVNWVVLGLLNPVIGSLSDRFGRKVVTAASLLTFVVGAIGSATAPTLGTLMAARVIMGCGQAVSVVATAILRDLVDDPQERLRVTSIFQTLQPLAIVAAPSVGGMVGDVFGWRVVFICLGCWGCLTMCLVSTFIPESNQQFLLRRTSGIAGSDAFGAPLLATPGGGPAALAEPEPGVASKIYRSWCGDMKQRQALFSHAQYIRLTVTAGLFMAGVRSMLATISFVYSQFYCVSAFYIGFLTAVPTAAGIGSSMLAGSLARKHSTDTLLKYGMLAGCLAPVCLFVGGLPGIAEQGWFMVAGPCAVMSATGFFVLPAMQVLILEDFKHMSGFAAGMSKLIMTLVSTFGSMAVSYFYSEADVDLDGGDHGGDSSTDCTGAISLDDTDAVNGTHLNVSTADVTVTATEVRRECVAGTSTAMVLGRSPPGFLLWVLCVCMVATQLCYWQWQCAARRRVSRERGVDSFTP